MPSYPRRGFVRPPMTVSQPPRRSVPGPRPASPALKAAAPAPTRRVSLLATWSDLTRGVRWTISLIGLLVYTWVITTYSVPLGTAAMVVALLGLLVPQERWRIPAPIALMFGFLSLCAIGLAQTAYPETVGDAVVLYVKLCLVALVLGNAIRTRAQLRFFIVFWLAAFAMYPLRGAYLTYFGYGATWNRAAWVKEFGNPNQMAALSLMMLGLCLPLMRVDHNPWIRRASLVGTLAIVLLVFLTQSRAAIIALALFALLFAREWWVANRGGAPRARRRATPKRLVQGLAFSVVCAAAVVKFAPQGVWDRMIRLGQFDSSSADINRLDDVSSTAQRLEIWKVAMKITRENPVVGIGLGAYESEHSIASMSPEFDPIARGHKDTHSTWLNVAAETGLPGLALFISIVGTVVLSSRRCARMLRKVAPLDAHQVAVAHLGVLAVLVAAIWTSFARVQFFYVFLVLVWVMGNTYVTDARRRGLLAPS